MQPVAMKNHSATGGLLTFRKARMRDLPLLERWEEAPHMIEAMPDFEWDYAEDLAHDPYWRQQLIAEADEQPIGFLQIIDAHREETHYWGDVPEGTHAIDIWIGEQDFIGKGYGWKMMNWALEQCFANSTCQQVLIDPFASNRHAISFYKKLGFRFVEMRIFDEEDEPCAVYQLSRSDWLARPNVSIPA